MRMTYVILVLACLLIGQAEAQIAIKGNDFYIDGKKFFIKGIGYEVGALPGRDPNQREFNAEQLRFDMARIAKGGFNTIRTWGAFTDEEMAVVSEFNLKIIMGIWIDPHRDFSDPLFADEARKIVSQTVSYTRKYNQIIGYLVMNEPLANDIMHSGYTQTTALWKSLVDIIHNAHPGRPVSIANTPCGTFVNPDLFDFGAYNNYIYNPVMVNFLHQYRNFTEYVCSLSSEGKPVVITEFGLSVSGKGPGKYGYGGNTLQEQSDGDITMYKGLVDGGAKGACVFCYSDGWWKGGNPYRHNNVPEEWFGLIEYANADDHRGKERPSWEAVCRFQSAVITSPRSEEIYQQEIPIEIFANDTIKRIEIYRKDSLLWSRLITGEYTHTSIPMFVSRPTDVVLTFKCYDEVGQLIKQEEKIILVTNQPITLPSIDIRHNADCWDTRKLDVTYSIKDKTDLFTYSDVFDCAYYPHIGFDYGLKDSIQATSDKPLMSHWEIGRDVPVFTIGGAFDLQLGQFKKRIYNQVTSCRPPKKRSLH